jgi:hypothetical protein
MLRGDVPTSRVIRADRHRAVESACRPICADTFDDFNENWLPKTTVGRTSLRHCGPNTPAFFVGRPSIVEIIPSLKRSLSCRERLLLRRMNKLRKTFIALITLAAVGLDPLFARLESWCAVAVDEADRT